LAISIKWYVGFFVLAALMKHDFKYAINTTIIWFIINSYFIVGSFNNFIVPYVYQLTRVPIIDGIYNFIGIYFFEPPYQIMFPVLFFMGTIILYIRKKSLVDTFVLLLLLFLLISKVYSPQFNLWVVPFLLMYQVMPYFITFELLNILIFPLLYNYVLNPETAPVYLILVLLRHINLLLLFTTIYQNRNKG
jgi:hypothetical protein